MRDHRIRRLIRAFFRDTWVLVRQFRYSLFFFLLFLTFGTLILRFTYTSERFLRWGEAFHMNFKLMFFETVGDFPDHPLACTIFILWPILGLVLVVNGVVRFGTALIDRGERKEAWQVAVASTYRNHVVVCGLGRVGYRVTRQLLAMQYEVVGIEDDPEQVFIELLRDEGIPVLLGDARNREMLEQARLQDAAAVVVCTEKDLTNLEVALEARDLKPGIKVVMRMFDQQLAGRVRRGFDIKTAFSTSALAAPAFAAAATRAAVEHSFYVDDVLLNVSRITIAAGSPLAGLAVEEVERDLDLSIILHRGAEEVDLHPSPDLVLEEGDQLVVFATLEALGCLNQMNMEDGECPPDSRGPRAWLRRLRGGNPA